LDKSHISLKRRLGLFDSAMMMVGIVVGSGIFLTTGLMAKSIPSAPLLLLAWIVGGLLVLAGALIYAELGAALPEAGGQYVYLREAYGALPGFLFGWKMFLVNMTGSIAALGVAFAEYFGRFFPSLATSHSLFSTQFEIFGKSVVYTLSSGQLVAVGVILFLTALNVLGVGLGKTIQNVLTVVKIGVLTALIFLALAFGKKTPVDWAWNPTGLGFPQLAAGFGVALIAVFWAFDGWNNINYVAGEIKNPKRNLTFALIFGTAGITLVYALTNLVYIIALPVNKMSGVVTIAERATASLFGTAAAGIFSAVILVSVLGALNGTIFVGPRVYYAMARDGLFFKRVARIHPRFQTPSVSLVFQAVWACLLALTGTFEQLFTFAMFAGILFWAAAAAAVFTLRKKNPHLPKPYKTWGYPVTPVVFIVVLSGILVNTLVQKPVESLAGVLLILTGVPVYFLWKRKV
jgi:APA family basic amino acid/polyamine antiporter